MERLINCLLIMNITNTVPVPVGGTTITIYRPNYMPNSITIEQ